jgi:predicted nucleic acid-binding protein
MNGIRILCDTNTLIHLLGNNKIVVDFLTEKKISISVITELELFGKPNLTYQEESVIDMLIDSCFVIELIAPVKQIFRQIKQRYRIKLPDAIIASTAIYLDIPLVTFDTDFERIEELKLVLLKL